MPPSLSRACPLGLAGHFPRCQLLLSRYNEYPQCQAVPAGAAPGVGQLCRTGKGPQQGHRSL